MLDLDKEIEEELKKLTEDGPARGMQEIRPQQAVAVPENTDLDMRTQPRGSGNDMNFWFRESANLRARGSGNDPQFRNALGPQKDGNESADDTLP